MAEPLDLVLHNGHVIDPANQRDGVLDVGIRAGRIAWDPTGLSMPTWTDAPSAYWQVPSLQL
jgi:predicted amidohydrolase